MCRLGDIIFFSLGCVCGVILPPTMMKSKVSMGLLALHQSKRLSNVKCVSSELI